MSIAANSSCYTVLEFWNSCDLGGILYQTQWRQRLFIDNDPCKPEYVIKEEGQEDGDGNFIPTFQREYKKYSLEWISYEYMLDAIYTIPTHDKKWIYLRNGESEEIFDIELSHEFITTGIAKVTMKYRTRYILKNNCCNNESVLTCLTPNVAAVSQILLITDVKYINPTGNNVLVGTRVLLQQSGVLLGVYTYIIDPVLGYFGWYPETATIGDIVTDTATGYIYYFDGAKFRRLMTQTLQLYSATSVRVKGFVYPSTFVQAQYKLIASPNWITFSQVVSNNVFNGGQGILITGLSAGHYDVRIHCWNHNCDYGYSVKSQITV